LEIAYLLGNWEIVYAYQPDERAVSIARFGIFLAQFGSVV
jgi:NOL1/NOP2/fmu family ribosome biogenesis protein